MNYHHPFEIIESWLRKNHLTASEKRAMKNALVSYATSHPVTSGLMSPYRFRYAMIAVASFVLVLGSSVGITGASLQSLPHEKLYPVKIWVEEFQAKNQKDPAAIIAFETKRIETRFEEATRLAMNHELNDATSQIIQSGLEHSREMIRTVANSLTETDPQLALDITNNLETTFSSNGKILATVEKNTGQNIGTIVLAAQVTTKNIALEKVNFEKIVALQPDEQNKDEALAKLTQLETKFARSIQSENPEPAPVTAMMTSLQEPATALLASIPETVTQTPDILLSQARMKIENGLYSDALVIIQKAERLIDEQQKIDTLEEIYNVQVEPVSVESTPVETPILVPEPSLETLNGTVSGTETPLSRKPSATATSAE